MKNAESKATVKAGLVGVTGLIIAANLTGLGSTPYRPQKAAYTKSTNS